MASMVNMNSLLNGKDSRWLQLEVCREFQRNKCSRPDTECKFAHPPATVEVQNGRVTACYDSIKVRAPNFRPDKVVLTVLLCYLLQHYGIAFRSQKAVEYFLSHRLHNCRGATPLRWRRSAAIPQGDLIPAGFGWRWRDVTPRPPRCRHRRHCMGIGIALT